MTVVAKEPAEKPRRARQLLAAGGADIAGVRYRGAWPTRRALGPGGSPDRHGDVVDTAAAERDVRPGPRLGAAPGGGT